MTRPIKSLLGVDDGPFAPDHRGDVDLVGVVYVGARLDGVVLSKVRRDGRNATEKVARLVEESRFDPKVVLMQGIALGGFNVVDIHALSERLDRPVLVVSRRAPNMKRIKRALYEHVPGGARKWRLIEKAGPMEPVGGLHVQRAGISLPATRRLLEESAVYGKIPEPLRVAHLLAGAVTEGQSRGGA